MAISSLSDDDLLLIFELVDITAFHDRSIDLCPLYGIGRVCRRWTDLAYRLMYANLRFYDAHHVKRFLQHVDAQRERGEGPKPNLETTKRLLLCMHDSAVPAAYSSGCLRSLFSVFPRLKQVTVLEDLRTQDLTVLCRLCGHSLEDLELVIAADSLDAPTMESFNGLNCLKYLSLTFIGTTAVFPRLDTIGTQVSLPEVSTLKLLFIDWHRSANAFFTAFSFPALKTLDISDSQATLRTPVSTFFKRHSTTLLNLDINTRPAPGDAWSLQSLDAIPHLRSLTLRWVPESSFCAKIPPSLEELCIPLFRYRRGEWWEEHRRSDTISYDSQWSFLDTLARRPPSGLKVLRGRNIYVGPESGLLDWSNVVDLAEPACAEQFINLADALKEKDIELLDWRGDRADTIQLRSALRERVQRTQAMLYDGSEVSVRPRRSGH